MVLGNFQCRGVILILIVKGKGATVLAVGAGGGYLDIFLSIIISLSPSFWEMTRYRLKYCLKGLFNPKQPTNNLNYFQPGKNMY